MPGPQVTPGAKPKRWFHLSFKDILKIGTSAFIPLMIGVFTLVLAFQQHRLSVGNRENDSTIAQDHRQEDRHRRLQDLRIADDIQKDTVLANYFHEMSELSIINNFTFTSIISVSIVRPKTLTVLRQLEASRKTLIVRFLYDIGLIKGNIRDMPRLLRDADLLGIICDKAKLPLIGFSYAHLTNASFVGTDIHYAHFAHAHLDGASFIEAELHGGNFYYASLRFTDFSNAKVGITFLSLADLTGSNINETQLMYAASLNGAILPNGTRMTSKNLFVSDEHSSSDGCDLSDWIIEPENSVYAVKVNSTRCLFNITTENISMSQKIDIDRFSMIIEREEAEIFMHYRLLTSTQVTLQHKLYDSWDNDLSSEISVAIADQYLPNIQMSSSSEPPSINNMEIQVILFQSLQEFLDVENKLPNGARLTTYDQVHAIIQNSPQYYNILVCPAKYIEQLKQLFANDSLNQIFVHGNFTPDLAIKEKFVISTDEQKIYGLLFTTVISYYHRQRQQYLLDGDHGLANQRAELINTLLRDLNAALPGFQDVQNSENIPK